MGGSSNRGGAGKIDMLLALLYDISAGGPEYGDFKGAVIYCDSSDAQALALSSRIASSGLRVSVHTILSKHPMARRNAILEEVNVSTLPPVLIVRYRMAAVGLNFVFANHAILFQMAHRVDFLHQAVGRLVRLGQRSTKIHVWPILFGGSFEESTYAAWRYAITTPPDSRSSNMLPLLCRRYLFPPEPTAVLLHHHHHHHAHHAMDVEDDEGAEDVEHLEDGEVDETIYSDPEY